MTQNRVGQIEKVCCADRQSHMVGIVVGTYDGVQTQIAAVAQRIEMQTAAIEYIVLVADYACRDDSVAHLPFVAVAEHVSVRAVAVFVTAFDEEFRLVAQIIHQLSNERHLLVEETFGGGCPVHIVQLDGEIADVEAVTEREN